MENENLENVTQENAVNNINMENTATTDLEENLVQDILSQNTITDTEQTTIEDTNTVTLETIHQDLGFICCFLIIASVLVFLKILYKLFNTLIFGG